MRQLSETHRIAGENKTRTKHRSKKYYGRKYRNFRPQVGDYVRILKELRINNTQEYYGRPRKVVEVLSKKNVVIELSDGQYEQKVVMVLIIVV